MIELKNAFIQLGILPEAGGALSYLKYHDNNILRPSLSDEKEANQSSLFPMIPYTSFIKDGHFPYFGIIRNVGKNCSFSKYPMHGDVWRSKLQIKNQSENSVTLSYQHNKFDGFPFSYSAEFSYTLKENILEIILILS